MGLGIGLMHYIGMSAMRMDAIMRYEPFLFMLSIVSAVALSILSLLTKPFFKKYKSGKYESAMPVIGYGSSACYLHDCCIGFCGYYIAQERGVAGVWYPAI